MKEKQIKGMLWKFLWARYGNQEKKKNKDKRKNINNKLEIYWPHASSSDF
jgi:hypothetical protein